MSLELLYTSATAGLRQGSRGFCTVLSTTGMPANLAQRLEMLSGYRHVFSPQDDQAAKNPISYSHVRIRLGGKSSSVLSRVAAYGTDYSGRTNKLAHHVVIEPHEQSPGGPAWQLAHGNIMRSEWAGQTQTPPSGPSIPQQHQTPRVCQTWAAMTGDAGWGGYVADAMSGAATKPLWLIFDLSQSQSLLILLDESIALLPESSRWSATFSTYYTNLPPEIDCRVRCVLAGTDEARLATARGSVIDLTTNRPLAAHTPLVELARTGHRSPGTPPPEVTAHAATASTLAIADEPPNFNGELDDFRLLPASVRSDVSSATRKHAPPPPRPVSSKKKLPLILATVAIVLFIIASGASVYAIKKYASQTVAAINEMIDPQRVGRTETQPQSNEPDPSETPEQKVDRIAMELGSFEQISNSFSDGFDPDKSPLAELESIGDDLEKKGINEIWSRIQRELVSVDTVNPMNISAELVDIAGYKQKVKDFSSQLNGAKTRLTTSKTQIRNEVDKWKAWSASNEMQAGGDISLQARFTAIDKAFEDLQAQIDQKQDKVKQAENWVTVLAVKITQVQQNRELLTIAISAFYGIANMTRKLNDLISADEAKRVKLENADRILALRYRFDGKQFILEATNPIERGIYDINTVTGIKIGDAKQFLGIGQSEGVVKPDELPSCYLYIETRKTDSTGVLRLGFRANSANTILQPRGNFDKQCRNLFDALSKFAKLQHMVDGWKERPTTDGKDDELKKMKTYNDFQASVKTMLVGLHLKTHLGKLDLSHLTQIDEFLAGIDGLPKNSNIMVADDPLPHVRKTQLEGIRMQLLLIIEARDHLAQPFKDLPEIKVYFQNSQKKEKRELTPKPDSSAPALTIKPILVLETESK